MLSGRPRAASLSGWFWLMILRVCVGADAERGIGVGKTIRGRWCARCVRARVAGTQKRLELRNIVFLQPQPARNAHQHRVLGRVHAAVGGNGHDLKLQEKLNQRCASAADPREPVDSGVEVEVRLLATIESGLGCTALLVLKFQHRENPLDSIDLVARDYVVCLAQRTHDGERRFDQLRLHDTQSADHGLPQDGAAGIAEGGTDDKTGKSAE
jgi:hypothetical protein